MTLPSTLVADTNIWIDLAIGRISIDVFLLPYHFIAPDLALAEVIPTNWSTLQGLGLQVHGLEPEDVLELVRLRQIHRRLSPVDLAALLLAGRLGACLVTGDRRLNELARAQGVPVHGVLWILDEMVTHHVVKSGQAAIALQEMLSSGARLPGGECQKRFEKWSS